PVFARDVLAAGPEGLGTLNAATSIGGTLSVLTLSLLPGRVRREPVLGLVFVVYGVSLVVLAQSQSLVLAAAVLLVTGACAAAFDLLQQTLIQLAVPEEQRGRAVGVWVLGMARPRWATWKWAAWWHRSAHQWRCRSTPVSCCLAPPRCWRVRP